MFAPIPPTPRSQSALPGGKGETFSFLMQGASPLASPGLNPRGTGSPCRCGKLNGGACLGVADSANVSGTRRGAQGGGRLPTLPSACFSAPIPPTPFPSGEGGDFRLFHARGFAPCIPGAGPGRHWLSLRGRRPAGGLPGAGGGQRSGTPALEPGAALGKRAVAASAGGGWLFRLPDLPAVAVPFCPYPPYPLPLRGRGSF